MKTFLIALICTSWVNAAAAQTSFNVYYLCLGSAYYEHDSKKFQERGFIPYDDLPEANVSAAIVARLLELYAGAKGLLVQATPNRMLTRKRILSAVDSLGKLAMKDKSGNALLVVYYCGHGISENLAWNQFLIPGDYTSIAGTKKFDALGEEMVYLGELTDKLDKLKQRYVVFADCCRKEESDNSLPEARLRYLFSEQNVATFKDLAAVLKFINEYHSINPVIFSTSPGEVAPVVAMPDNDLVRFLSLDTSYDIGPICRRLLLLGTGSGYSKRSLKELVTALTDQELDHHSPVSVSFYTKEEDPKADLIFFR